MSVIRKLLLKDVKVENETNRKAFMLRFCCLIMIPYYLIVMALYLRSGALLSGIISLVCLIGYLLTIYLTYTVNMNLSTALFYVMGCGWIIFSVMAGGWGQGSAYLWFVLLLFTFATSHERKSVKILEGVLLYAGGYLLYLISTCIQPWIILSVSQRRILEGINTAVTFFDIIAIMQVFASATITAERKLEKYNEELKLLAGQDPLTQLPNRRAMTSYIVDKVTHDKVVATCIAMGDIDFFKKVNDTYGHEAGDKVLGELSGIMKAFMKDKGMVARWGGEEFLFYFYESNLDVVGVWMRILLDQIRECVIPFGDLQIHVTMTFGVVDAILEGENRETIQAGLDKAIMEADNLLYTGKESGRNRVVL